MKVYIAEKPSVGRALADRLAARSPIKSKSKTSVEGADWAVCWLSGHVYQLAEPDHYIEQIFPDAKRGANGEFPWEWKTLPLLPALDQWKLLPDRSKSDLISTVKDLVKRATVVVHAGDIDREGQLLVDEILEVIGCKKPVRRVLPTAIDQKSIDRALANERDNRDFRGMRDAAKARSCSDWLVGMNYSRAVTVRGQDLGSRGYTTIGRVQTPILGLIVQRELEINNFKPQDYLSLSALIAVQGGRFRARWKPREGQPGLDAEGRLIDAAVAAQIQRQVTGQLGTIADYKDESKNENAPLPFAIQDIQKLAARKFGMGLDKTLQVVQSLYATHKAVSYPRSDCSYLPSSQHRDAPEIIQAVQRNLPSLCGGPIAAETAASRKSRAFNDSKVSAHHAIVPTGERINVDALSFDERRIYEEICKRYIAQFMPAHQYRAVSCRAEVSGHDFVASGRTTIKPGWKAIYGLQDAPSASLDQPADDESDNENVALPPMRKGEGARCEKLDSAAKKTKPPSRFTDETLLDAMVNIHKFCASPKVREHFLEMLKKSKSAGEDEAQSVGIGTPATRHTFAPKLVDVGLVETVAPEKKGGQKSYKPSDAGMALVQALPGVLTRPDTSAVWDMAFGKIEAGEVTLAQFMASQEGQIRKTIDLIKTLEIRLPEKAAPVKRSAGTRSAPRRGGPSSPKAGGAGDPCAKCGSGTMRKLNSPRGEFYGCSNYPTCKHTANAA